MPATANCSAGQPRPGSPHAGAEVQAAVQEQLVVHPARPAKAAPPRCTAEASACKAMQKHAETAVCLLSSWCLLLQQSADRWKHVIATWRCLPRSNTPSCSPLCPLPLLPPSGEEYRSYNSVHSGGCCGGPCGWRCCGFCGRGGVDSAAMVRCSCASSLPCKSLVHIFAVWIEQVCSPACSRTSRHVV
jgi:hypothetical protein